MSSPYPVTSLFGTLLFLVRHEPHAVEDHRALVDAIRAGHDRGDILLEVEQDSLVVDGRPAMLEAPGATLLFEQMYLHGIRAVRIPPQAEPPDLLRFAVVLAAFPGTYDSYQDVIAALGASAARLSLVQG